MKIKQSDSWVDFPSSAIKQEVDADEGYIGERCSDTSFIAGSVLSLDCNNIAVRNQAPNVSPLTFDPDSDDDIIITLDATDTDFDYLIYNLIEIPTNGFLDYNNLGEPIPNTDDDSSQLVYTPASNPPEDDIIRYSVTDARIGHTVEGLITITGTTPGPTIPDAVDDFDFSLAGTNITFTWSHPDDGGSLITFYALERSSDTVIWIAHDVISETLTSYDYLRHEGYDEYWRIMANNAIGYSASSDILHVHIDDTTGPVVTINNPTDGETLPVADVYVDGFIFENENSGIEDIEIKIDDVIIFDPIFTDIISKDVSVDFYSTLLGISNGPHTLSVFASNRDGYTGSDSVLITVDIPVSSTLDSLTEDFQTDMSNWILTTGDDEFWSVRTPSAVTVPDSLPENTVGGTEDCDDVCTMIMIDHVDLTFMVEPTLSFYRFVSSADIPGEGIIIYYSEDDGFTWNVLDSFLADDSEDDGIWHLEEYDLSIYSTTEFKLKIDAISSANSEDTELDDISITDAAAVVISNETPLVIISLPSDGSMFNDSDSISFTGNATDTEDGDITVNLTWISDIDGIIGSGGSFTESLTFGTHIITANVTDSDSAVGSDSITITIEISNETLTAQITELQNQIISMNDTLTALDEQVSVIEVLVDYIDTFLDAIYTAYAPDTDIIPVPDDDDDNSGTSPIPH